MADALRGVPDVPVRFLGAATEGSADPFRGIPSTRGKVGDLATALALVLPAWIEHQPRIALLALASGVPVIATEDCGLPEHPLLKTLPAPDSAALEVLLHALLHPNRFPIGGRKLDSKMQ